ncbi:MAG: hypothetical protein HYY51_00440 [Candidatus Magasanikbacteria bacterium]|nr:hypothetical protein [Candidatus Magasanikbacteria bacterium]
MRRVRSHADTYKDTDFSRADSTSIYTAMEGFLLTTRSQWAYAYHYVMVNRILSDIILKAIAESEGDVLKQNEYFNDLLQLPESSEYQLERIALCELAEYAESHGMNEEFNRRVDAHLAMFAHLGRYLLHGSGYDREVLTNRVRDLIKKGLDKERKKIEEAKRMSKKGFLLRDILGLSDVTLKHINSAAAWAAASNNAEASYAYAVHTFSTLFQRLANDFDISYIKLVNLRGEELLRSLKAGVLEVNSEDLEARAKDPSIVLDDKTIMVYVGADLIEYKKDELRYEEYDMVKELKGQVASKSALPCEGRVCIVLTNKNAERLERGDILVASATNPLLVPAMERAGAIVTDEGGLLSHAAIVSRELGLPCIVGTRCATKILKDGDMVEVDTALGIVRRLEKFNLLP